MRTDIRNREDIIKGHKNYQRYLLVLLCLSALVAAVVTISLIEPAVTMSYTCGMEEHIHTESCYTLTCEQTTEEDGSEHIHSIDKGCYDTSAANCGMSEHVHNVDCEEKTEEASVEEETESSTEYSADSEVTETAETFVTAEDETIETTETTISADESEVEATATMQMTGAVTLAENETQADAVVSMNYEYVGQNKDELTYNITIENTSGSNMPKNTTNTIDPKKYTEYREFADGFFLPAGEISGFVPGDMMLEIIIPGDYMSYPLTIDAPCYLPEANCQLVESSSSSKPIERTGRFVRTKDGKQAFVYPLDPLKAGQKYVIGNPATIKAYYANGSIITVNPVVRLRYFTAANSDEITTLEINSPENWTADLGLSLEYNSSNCNFDSANDVINWSYTLQNPNGLDLSGLVIKDNNFKGLESGPKTTTPTITDSNGQNVAGTFDYNSGTFTFDNSGNNKSISYTFNYALDSETRAGSNQTVVTVKSARGAVLAEGTSEEITVPSRIDHWATIGSYNSETKTAEARFVYNFMFPKQDVKGKEFICKFAADEHLDLNKISMSEEQKQKINVMLSDGNSTEKIFNKDQNSYTVTWNEREAVLTVKLSDSGLPGDFDNGARRIWVAMTVSLKAGELVSGQSYRKSVNFTGTYQPESSFSGLFANTSTSVGNIVTTVSIGKQYKLYDKHDTSMEDEKATTHQYSDIDGVLRWYIDGNYGTKYENDKDVPFKITLPEGLTYVDDAKLYVKDSNGILTEQTSVLRKDISVNKREITLTIPASSAVLTGNSEFVIDFGAKAPVTAGDAEYTVSVENFGDPHTQKQTITPSVISKSSSQEFFYAKDNGGNTWVKCESTDVGAQLTGSRKADYVLQINPKKQTLNGGNKITVVDYLGYVGLLNAEWYPEFITDSIKVYENGSSTPLDKSKYGLTLMNYSHTNELEGGSSGERGLKMTLTLNDSTSYIVKYSYHLFVQNNQADYTISDLKNVAKILDSSGTELGRAVLSSTFKCNYYIDDLTESDGVSVRAIDVENGGKAVPGCVMMLLKYNKDTNGWKYYTNSSTWSDVDFTEISDLISQRDNVKPYEDIYKGKIKEYVTDENGYVSLPNLDKDAYYRIVEIKPADGYQVNAEKFYSAAIIDNGGVTVGTLPLRVNPDNLTNVKIINDKQYGTIYVENTPVKKRTVNWSKEWIDDKTTHDPVTFDVYSSHKVYSTQSVKNVSLKFSKNGQSVYTSTDVKYGGYIHFKIDGLAFASDPHYIISVQYGSEIMETEVDDASSGYSSKYFGAQNLYTSYFSDGTVVYLRRWHGEWVTEGGNAVYKEIPVEVWCNCVKKDIKISFTSNNDVQNTFSWSNDSIKVTGDVASGTEDNVANDFESVKTDGTKETQSQITLNDSNDWKGSITDVPTTDPYGYNLYYYVLEDPKINTVPGYGDYEVRYVNNGGAKLDENGDVIESEITVINKLTGYIKALPSTGGIGTNVYVDIGAAVILCGVLGCIIKKRPRKHRKGGY